MDFYRISEEYIQFLQKYEKKKEGLRRFLIFVIKIGINLRLELFYK